jgi:hypothetical protein
MESLAKGKRVIPFRNNLYSFAAAMLFAVGKTAQLDPANHVVPAIRDPGALCARALQWDAPDTCPSFGPAVLRADFWLSGLFPRRLFPMQVLDASLAMLDRSYAKVDPHLELPVFKTLDAALRNNEDHHLEKGFVYISYTQSIERKGQQILETGGGWYIHREEVSAKIDISHQFHGVILSDAPPHAFGWVVNQYGSIPYAAPGQPPSPAAQRIPYYGPVEVFGSQEANGILWYEVGIREWLPQHDVGLVFPVMDTPQGIPMGERWIGVNLAEQTLAAYTGTHLEFATLASTGVTGFWTRPGLFHVKKKWDLQSMSGAFKENRSDFYFVQDVPFVMYFDSSRAIHGAYWHNAFGYPRSHGCVNLPVADAHWVYDFASEGTWVYVFDPTGKTPTHDAAYQWDGLAP